MEPTRKLETRKPQTLFLFTGVTTMDRIFAFLSACGFLWMAGVREPRWAILAVLMFALAAFAPRPWADPESDEDSDDDSEAEATREWRRHNEAARRMRREYDRSVN